MRGLSLRIRQIVILLQLLNWLATEKMMGSENPEIIMDYGLSNVLFNLEIWLISQQIFTAYHCLCCWSIEK